MRPPGGGATGRVQGHTTPGCGLPQGSTRTGRPPARQAPEPALGPGTALPTGLARQVAGHQTDEASALRWPQGRQGDRAARPHHGWDGTAVAWPWGRQRGWGRSQQEDHVSRATCCGAPHGPVAPSLHVSPSRASAVTCSYQCLVVTPQGAGDPWPQDVGGPQTLPPTVGPEREPRSGGKGSWGPDPQGVAWGPRHALLAPCGHVH